jgi:ketosteroid isomerase-like protein
MSRENVEIVRRAVDAWNSQDFETGMSLVDPEIEVEVAIGTPVDGTYRGHAGLTQFMADFWGQFETFHSEVRECTPAGDDQVVLHVLHHGTGRGSGAAVEMPGWQVFSVRAGKITRWRNFRSRQEVFEAAGLSV